MTTKNDHPLRLKDVILDRKKFSKRNNAHVLILDEYHNDEYGVMISFDRKLRSVNDIELRPSKILIEQYLCPAIE